MDQEFEVTKKPQTPKDAADKVVKNIRIVLAGLRGEDSITESLYCSWSKEFLEAAIAGYRTTRHVRQRRLR